MSGKMRALKWILVLLLSGILLRLLLGTGSATASPTLARIPSPTRSLQGEEMLSAVDVTFVLTTAELEDRLAYVGISENIEGVLNPDLRVEEGSLVELVLINTMETVADVSILGYGIGTPTLVGDGAGASMVFDANEAGEYIYCSRDPVLRELGLRGRFTVRARPWPGPVPTRDLIQASR